MTKIWSYTPTAAPTATDTPFSPPASATPTPGSGESIDLCPGDCDRDGGTTVDEILTLVDITLGDAGVDACAAGDVNRDGRITVDELLKAIEAALDGCQPPA